ncbi:DUF423 domain-containing protein [Rhodospirillaceae bacterium KN72]|uniref:DUF423 domain-containing protein n=1 Tax=Pacificispira spongiicola TaxID=2729598 RepID=A0A7Y0DZY7_9PROT|nr:DUF423 domain-containing protein [Pacificispira spongiicola]NMM44697.1 DUF423 domain-containing protein [Pacificispira spongiicola]
MQSLSPQSLSPAFRLLILIAGIFGALGVALAALASHGLEATKTELEIEWVATASRFLMFHALALIGTGYLTDRRGGLLPVLCGVTLALGTGLFCGSLLMLAFVGSGSIAMMAPVGGSLMILGWIGIALCGIVPRR